MNIRTGLVVIFTALLLVACGGRGSVVDTAQQTADALAAQQQAAQPTLSPSPTDEPLDETLVEVPTVIQTEAAPTLSEFQMTLAAAGTQQAPTIMAGQTQIAETKTAMPTPTARQVNALATVSTETVDQNGTQVAVTAISSDGPPLSGAWTEVYSLGIGMDFVLSTNEVAFEQAILSSMAAAGYGGSIEDLTVRLDNNLIALEFSIVVGATSNDGRMSFGAFAQNGEVIITMISLQFGQFTVPPDMLDGLNAAIALALVGAQSADAAQVTVHDIIISGGVMTVTGTVGAPSS